MDRRPGQQKTRKFKIRTKFGGSRQQRSRKNRPCDTCRKRKTACIIETLPPCERLILSPWIIELMIRRPVLSHEGLAMQIKSR